MRGWLLATLLGAFGAALLEPGDVAGQTPFLLVPTQPLDFGRLAPGVPARVASTDVVGRGEVRLQGEGTTSVLFTLPDHLAGPGGARVPLVFAADDGLWQIRNRQVRFDPAQPFTIRLNPNADEARIFLGGTALPAPGQPAGRYTATVTVMTVQTGT